MKLIIVLSIACAVAWAAPEAMSTTSDQDETLHAVYDKAEDVVLDDEGNFSVRFVGEDGTTVKEEGVILEDESTGSLKVIVQKGYYSYYSDDGIPVELVYDAANPGDVVLDE